MIPKHLICPQRLRCIPNQFSWVDHRLVRDRHIESCSHGAAALYLFLIAVADHQGLSYYSDPSLMTRLAMDLATLGSARQNLIRIGLIAYESPLYQVLSLEPVLQSRQPLDQPVSIGLILNRIMGESS
ncbi:MAG: hypothetical protein QG555_282 [Thermodesulfobacteriota bacterium]|nr:hypothetical protein [Thermodesulfobacteriota bacterium]